MESMEFAELVKEVRKQLKLSQEDLARELGVVFSTVNRWENQKVNPSKLAKNQFRIFLEKKGKQGRLNTKILSLILKMDNE